MGVDESDGSANEDVITISSEAETVDIPKKANSVKDSDSANEVLEAGRDKRNKSILPWVEKYRPAVLGDLISHQDITATIQKFIDMDQLPHLLFYGPPGMY